MGAKKIFEYSQYENLIHEKLKNQLDWSKILICDGLGPGELINLVLMTEYRHISQNSHRLFNEELNTGAYLSDPNNQFSKYPLSSILAPHMVSQESEQKLLTYKHVFNSAENKFRVLGQISENLRAASASSAIVDDSLMISDELLTNAVYNAPFVDMLNSRSGISRDRRDVKMLDGKQASIFLAVTESRIVIGCEDPYGSLNLVKLLERIKRCIEGGVAQNINMTGGGGAGIGSFMVFNAVESFYAYVHEGHHTMICCSLPLKMGSRKREGLSKNLNLIIKK